MTILLLLAVILILELFTHKSALEILTPILKRVWGVIEWVILFLFRMDEPRGEKS